MKYEKYLPIGTVVLLKGGTKKVMITGFCSVADNDKNKTYDYSGCLYPEGFLSSNQTLLFDHSQIDKLYFIGYQNAEEKEFKEKLKVVISKIDNAEL